jgi:hypothetical protein
MQETSRRTVLGAGLGLLGLAVIGVDEAGAEAAAAPVPARHLFAPSLGKVFTAQLGNHTHRLRLTAVDDLPHTGRAYRDRCFSLLFTPTGRHELPDGIYRLRRPGGANHSLSLVRVGTGRTLQAVVNRSH